MQNKKSIASILCVFTGLALAQDPTPDVGWQAVAGLLEARYDHCAVALTDGRILVAGGIGNNGKLNTAEIYGPDDVFLPVAPMSVARSQHSCTLLSDGRVLVAGGADSGSAELFDPVSGAWSPVDGNVMNRHGHTATPISGGKVLLAGGLVGNIPMPALQVYDPVAQRIDSISAVLAVPRARHTAALLSDGRVLFIGGTDGSASLASTEIFDPFYGTIAPGPSLAAARSSHFSVTLDDRRVLVAGGADANGELASGEIFSESAGTFSPLASFLTIPRQNAFATLIPGSGLVLIGGGENAGQAIPDTELFVPQGNQFVVAGSLTAPRTRISGAALANGVILAIGGLNADGPSKACGVFASSRLTLTEPQYNPGEVAHVNGTGFSFAGSTIMLSLTAKSSDGSLKGFDSSRLLTTSAAIDATGQFSADILNVQSPDAGTTFFLSVHSGQVTGVLDGTSNTVMFSNQPQASFTVSNLFPTTLTFDPIPVSSVAGSTIPFNVTLSSVTSLSSPPPPAFNGLLHIRIGPTVQAIPVSNVASGVKTIFNFCCVTTSGSQLVNVNYAVDPVHSPVTVNGPNHTVVAPQVQLSLGGALPLFTQVNLPATLSVPAVFGPAPTGTVTLARAGASQTVAISAGSSTTLTRTASLPYRATLADKPQACFTLSYSGDSRYPAASANPCLKTTAATTSLQLQGPSSYDYGTNYVAGTILHFPQELGLSNETIHFDPPGVDSAMSVHAGIATDQFQFTPTFNQKSLTATYSGGTDVGSSTSNLAFSMNPVQTSTQLTPVASPASNPLTLRATVTPVVAGQVVAPPAPSGTIQFFDGTLFLGQVALTAQTNGSAIAVLGGQARPVGARALKAVYLGSSLFATSTSPVLSVTVR